MTAARHDHDTVETTLSVALAIAFGDTARTFGAGTREVVRVLSALTGIRISAHGPAIARFMQYCRGHVRGQLPDPLAAFDPPPPNHDDIVDTVYMASIATKYGRTIRLQPLPKN